MRKILRSIIRALCLPPAIAIVLYYRASEKVRVIKERRNLKNVSRVINKYGINKDLEGNF